MKKMLSKSRAILSNSILTLSFFLFVGILAPQAYAQSGPIKVTGTVLDSEGLPIIGASVIEKGNNTHYSITDADGKYSVTVSGPTAILEAASLGYVTKEETVGQRSVINFTLEEDNLFLEETVVIGYGTQKKADVTSSVASVKKESFNKGAITDAGQLVQGKVAGLQITTATGDPTSTSSVMLRGTSTMYGSNEPLILVDGVPGSFSTVAPEDIESIDVLKDGSATAIYGTRGTNGVIIITTKNSQREMPSTIEYNGYVSVSEQYKKADFMTAADLRQKMSEGWSFSGANDQDYGATTDWLKEISQTGVSTVHDLTFKTGSKNSSLLANLTYDYRQGTMRNTGGSNIRGRVQGSFNMFDNKLIATINVIANESNNNIGFNSDNYRQSCIHNPTEPVYNEDGTYSERPVYFYDNPVARTNERDGMYRSRNLRLTGGLEYRPIESISLKGTYTRKGQNTLYGYYQTHNDPSNTEGGNGGSASRSASDYVTNLAELTAAWNQAFGKSSFSAIIGYSYEDNTYESFNAYNNHFPTDAYSYNNLEIGLGLDKKLAGMGSYKESDKLIGLFARATYNYDDRYLVMVSFRREGSSKFGADHKWGNFPGVSLGWRLNNEEWMKSATWLDNLKIRAGFGITGTNAGSSYLSLSSLNYDTKFLINGEWLNSLVPVRNPNADLRWEKKYEYNVGIDFDMFGGRFGGAIDLYQRDTKDALWSYSVPVPPYLYGSIVANVGQIRNKGVEVMLNATPIQKKNFSWYTNVTYSTNKNELIAISNDQFQMSTDYFYSGYTGEPIQTTTHRVKVGDPIGNFYGLKSVGLNEEGKWIVERLEKDEDGNVTGKYYGTAEDANESDWQVLGNGVPKHYLNWNNTFNFFGVDLSINMRGAFGFQILNYQKMYYGNPTIQYNVLNCAFDEHDIVDLNTGKATGKKTTINDSQRYVSEYIENGDYWKIDNVTLGYTFNMSKVKKIQNIRLYASMRNLFTFTNYSGLDPEVEVTGENALYPGTDSRDKYPTIRSYTFGLNITF